MSLGRFFQEDLPRIQQELQKKAAPDSVQPLVFELSPIDLNQLKSYAACERVFYYSSKDHPLEFLGLGTARFFTATELHHLFSQFPEVFVSTDLLFEGPIETGPFILHEWSFITRENRTTLVIFKHSDAKMYSSPALILDEHTPVDEQDFIPPWTSYEEFPEHDEWAAMIEKAHQLFESGELQKLVLSRRKIFGYEDILDPMAFFNNLLKKNAQARSFKIFHRPRFGEAFLCLSPEKLFTLQKTASGDHSFESISLAGSAPRGKTPEEDQHWEEHLRTNEKLIREHALVTEELRLKLGPLSRELVISELITMKLPYIQHRQADIKALLKNDIDVIKLLELLHPTPAIGGLPWDKARLRLAEIEPFKRDHYAAPIGIVSAHFSEMAVGIRSAYIEGEQITLYGGAGIVQGSDSEEEWLETGTKMNPFLKVINNE